MSEPLVGIVFTNESKDLYKGSQLLHGLGIFARRQAAQDEGPMGNGLTSVFFFIFLNT